MRYTTFRWEKVIVVILWEKVSANICRRRKSLGLVRINRLHSLSWRKLVLQIVLFRMEANQSKRKIAR